MSARVKFISFATVLILSVFGFAAAGFSQTGGLKGKVRTFKGDGIANASVTARRDGKDVKTVRSDSKGNFVMEGLDAGNYNIVFDADGYASGVLYNVEVKKKKIRDLPDRLILFVDQGTLVIVKGSVFTREGASLEGAKIELEKINADGSTKSLGSAVTSRSGEFTFRQPQGVSKLRVTAKFKGVSGSKTIEVVNAGIHRLAITLNITRK